MVKLWKSVIPNKEHTNKGSVSMNSQLIPTSRILSPPFFKAIGSLCPR